MRQPNTTSNRYRLYRNLKARIVSTELQYHVRLKHLVIGLLMTVRAHIVRRIALFFSRDAAWHSRRVFRLRMPDCLVTLVDQCADSEGLQAMDHLEKLTSLFSRQEDRILRLRSLESTVVHVVLILQHLSSSTETCEVVSPLNARSLGSPKVCSFTKPCS